MPVASLAELQPIFAVLAGSPDAAIDLTLVAGRRVAAEIRDDLDAAFRFYGLCGQLVVVADSAPLPARLDAGLAAAGAAHVLFWQPCVLPKARGWLARLVREAERTGAGQISPALTYEDGSIYFAGERRQLSADEATCARAGFGGASLGFLEARPVSAAAAEIFLVDRVRLVAAGGVAGHLFSDAFTHLDLARRLAPRRRRDLVRAAGRILDAGGPAARWRPARPDRPRRRCGSDRPPPPVRGRCRRGGLAMKALILSHAHPAFSIGGAQVASWNLFEGLKAQPGWDAHYLAGVSPPVVPHKATPLMSLGRGPDETLYWSNDFDWFHLGSKDLGGLMAHFERFLRDLRPDVVNFHHVMGFGIQAIRAIAPRAGRRADRLYAA